VLTFTLPTLNRAGKSRFICANSAAPVQRAGAFHLVVPRPEALRSLTGIPTLPATVASASRQLPPAEVAPRAFLIPFNPMPPWRMTLGFPPQHFHRKPPSRGLQASQGWLSFISSLSASINKSDRLQYHGDRGFFFLSGWEGLPA